MIELLRRASEADPDRIALVADDRSYSYGELTGHAEAVATRLRELDVTRFATVTDDAAAVVALLAGASSSGSEMCQYPPTDDPSDALELARQFDHDVVVTDRAPLIGIEGLLDIDVVLPRGSGEQVSTGADDLPASRPVMVLTTGTTGARKGVRHDWARMLRGAAHIRPAPDERWLLAYGLHQFAGLQVLVHVMAAGAALVAPAQRRPRDALSAIRRHRVGHVSATPTWWRFLLAELKAEGGPPPALQQITLGGEASSDALLARLATTFERAHVSHVYAASEIGSTGSVRDGRGGFDLTILQRDEHADVAMRIVDGELWVRSRIGMLGYYGEELADPNDWRPTGDLVEVVGDRIEFRGRASEVINVGGVKVHPLPIEELVGRVPGVQVARVFGRPNKLTGAIVAIEVVADPGADSTVVTEAIRSACAGLPAAARPRSIRIVDGLATQGGKIIRRDSSAG